MNLWINKFFMNNVIIQHVSLTEINMQDMCKMKFCVVYSLAFAVHVLALEIFIICSMYLFENNCCIDLWNHIINRWNCVSDLQPREPIWLHGTDFTGRKNELFWKESRWIPEDGSDEWRKLKQSRVHIRRGLLNVTKSILHDANFYLRFYVYVPWTVQI